MFSVVLLAIVLGLVFWWVQRYFEIWKRRGIPYISPWKSVLFMFQGDKAFTDVIKEAYDEFPDSRYCGSFQFARPVILIRDVELIKRITIKDFDHFLNRNSFSNEKLEPLMAKNLASLKGQKWRDMRSTLSPSFTGRKMRAMFVLISEVSGQFVRHFEKRGSQTIELDMKDAFTRLTNDVIASSAFGVKCDSLEERQNEFYTMGKEATTFTTTMMLKFVLLAAWPELAAVLKVRFFSEKFSTFFRRIVKETLELRESGKVVRPDMMQLLMEAKKGRSNQLQEEEAGGLPETGFAQVQEDPVEAMKAGKTQLSDDDITAQALIFFFAGFEASSTLMCLIAHELAVNPDVQDNLQKEIDEAFETCGGELTYEVMMGMKYLDMVVSETLRKWPPGPQLDRICDKDYTIPAETADETDFVIEKGTMVLVPVYGVHRDPRYYPNPDKFDPERFSDENKGNIEPLSYFPFGSGPRNCIASRFALMESKTAIVHLLLKFDLVPIRKTCVPLKLVSKSFNILAKGGFWLGLRKRTI